MALLPSLWQQGDYAVMSGGSMMYVDAVCKGIDYIPDISDEVRAAVKKQWQENGLEPLLAELERLDPIYYAQVDRLNPVRVIHAVEICRQAGVPYSSLRTGKAKQRPFNIIKVGLNIDRPALFDRINRRVDAMIEHGPNHRHRAHQEKHPSLCQETTAMATTRHRHLVVHSRRMPKNPNQSTLILITHN